MRKVAIAVSLAVLSLSLSACSKSSSQTDISAASLDTAEWASSARRELAERVAGRAAHGLDHIAFPAPGDDAAALTAQALRLAGALSSGVSDPAALHEVYTLKRPAPDLRKGLAAALAKNAVGQWLDSLAPQDEGYRQLSKAYLAIVKGGAGQGAAAPTAPAVPVIPERAKPLEPGSSDPRIPAIARQLGALGYLDGGADRGGSSGQVYDPTLVKAVRRMQADYGIKPDGIIGGDALEILNLSDGDRARMIAVAMERLRWLDRQPPETRIDVNIAAARLTYWRDGRIVDSRRVVVGEPDTETPQLQSPIFRLVANPTWTVPRSIQRKEIEGKGGDYLRRNNMTWKDGWVVQKSGPKNSLGLVKFDMQNEHSIYLHDTPAKALFSEAQRQRSHGCVRVEDALGFAEMIARDEGVLDAWRKARATGDETFVKLPRQIPVRLMYQTVLIDEGGNAVVRSDPYGWDDRVAKALGFSAATMHRLRGGGGDVGP
ncbi:MULTISPECIES: L,D-transpeptidase family protein [unclassified Sphingomonas]|uniref:L,D-transpeptidase family protein n=1 Tax=unclassified Sphingomonas TaxID=196159 RepID=UPI0006FEF0D3|nr:MULTISPECIES: L,D-transpeptidase family protein [unclassified Sphingomonas]KQX17490.1 peptidoglycan-binding protein [Sphingomonas sp. Root1294]KQY70416.1 peptidoglycan-binding protein [Sphingomonas sp. Root50]KRB92098.1 peptidoglycan-binding protein [Sphingomonas sp. Root720]